MFRPTYLVQRLKKKPENKLLGKAVRVFGGGALQLTDDAWDMLQAVFDIDPMGAAEYEWGKIPTVLGDLIRDREKLTTFVTQLGRQDVAVNQFHQHVHDQARREELAEARKAGIKAKRAKPFKAPDIKPVSVYAICRAEQISDVNARIRELAMDRIQTKNGNYFADALDPNSKYGSDLIGWLELDNGFFFFIDRLAFEGTVDIFLMGNVTNETEESRAARDFG